MMIGHQEWLEDEVDLIKSEMWQWAKKHIKKTSLSAYCEFGDIVDRIDKLKGGTTKSTINLNK